MAVKSQLIVVADLLILNALLNEAVPLLQLFVEQHE
jgi:hypothetical protein